MKLSEGCLMYRKCLKRLLDIVISSVGLIALSPLLVVLAILIRVKLGKPIIFEQDRPGRGEKIFKLYKFRSMTDERDSEGNLLPDEKRLTRFGKALRATSLDELPELFNILRGDMSLIGPRPLLVSYLPYYTDKERLRHTVRPGLTGLAQVNGRNYLDWDNRLKKDIEYVENLCFLLDVRILFLTVKMLLKHGDGVAENTNSTEGNFAQIRQRRLEETGSLERG